MREALPSLEQVLRTRLFKVADYQRPYSWEEKQLEDLWGDLDLLGTSDHYTGTLVLKDSAEARVYTTEGEELIVFEVVDGQQRLTTLLILLERLRRALLQVPVQKAADAAEKVDQLLRVKVDGVRRNRIALADEFDEYFARHVLAELPPTGAELLEGQRRLSASAAFFDARFRDLVHGVQAEVAYERLMRVRVRATHRLKFLVYDVENAAEVGVLFETLNDRGRELSELEKVKNYLLYLARQLKAAQREDLSKKINAAWADIFRNLARAGRDDDLLLRAHWLVTQNSNERSWQRALSVKEKFPRSIYVASSERLSGSESLAELTELDEDDTTLFQSIVNYVESLRMCAVYLRDVWSEAPELIGYSDERVKSEILSASAAFRRTNRVAHFLPILLAVRLAFPDDGQKYLETLKLAERFSARVFAISGLRSNAGRTTVTWAANKLHARSWTYEDALGVIRAKALQLAPDTELRRRLAADQYWYGRSGLKFVLYEYEVAGVRAEEDAIGWERVTGIGSEKTIEHVLPQHPESDSQWLIDFPDPEERLALTHSIGNLVLTRDNSAYGNRDFRDHAVGGRIRRGKRGEDGDTGRSYINPQSLYREREIAHNFLRWTPCEIEQRRRTIEDWALQRWRIETPTARADDDVLGAEDGPVLLDEPNQLME